jgi:hypothetical protein
MKAAQLLVFQSLLLSVSVAHRGHMLLQQDDTDEVQLIISDFSTDDAPPKTQTQSLPQVT